MRNISLAKPSLAKPSLAKPSPTHVVPDPEFIQRMVMLLANGIVLRLPAQTKAAAKVLAHEFNVPWPVRD